VITNGKTKHLIKTIKLDHHYIDGVPYLVETYPWAFQIIKMRTIFKLTSQELTFVSPKNWRQPL